MMTFLSSFFILTYSYCYIQPEHPAIASFQLFRDRLLLCFTSTVFFSPDLADMEVISGQFFFSTPTPLLILVKPWPLRPVIRQVESKKILHNMFCLVWSTPKIWDEDELQKYWNTRSQMEIYSVKSRQLCN